MKHSDTLFNRTAIHTGKLEQSHYRFDLDLNAAFFYMSPSPRPCFNLDLLKELKLFQQATEQHVRHEINNHKKPSLKYTVLASNTPGVFNLGGDLQLFVEYIKNKDRDALLAYAVTCIDVA